MSPPLPLRPRGLPLSELDLPAKLLGKLQSDGVIEDTFDLRVLHPDAIKQFWKLTAAEFERLNKALEQRGITPMESPSGARPTKAAQPGCPEPGRIPDTSCGMTRMKGKRKCGWHYLLGIPIEKQIIFADDRAKAARARDGHVERARVPKDEWPEGGRWCSECQAFIPWVYVTGSRCRAHASRAAHASMTARVYDLTREDYERLLRFQKGRCYICRQEPHSKRLAVDHDHSTNEVRGLLCANDEWGCNVSLRRLLNNLGMAQRALEYVTLSPWARLNQGVESAAEESAAPAWNPFEVLRA